MNIVTNIFDFLCNRRWLCRLIAIFNFAIIATIAILNSVSLVEFLIICYSALAIMAMGSIVGTSLTEEYYKKDKK